MNITEQQMDQLDLFIDEMTDAIKKADNDDEREKIAFETGKEVGSYLFNLKLSQIKTMSQSDIIELGKEDCKRFVESRYLNANSAMLEDPTFKPSKLPYTETRNAVLSDLWPELDNLEEQGKTMLLAWLDEYLNNCKFVKPFKTRNRENRKDSQKKYIEHIKETSDKDVLYAAASPYMNYAGAVIAAGTHYERLKTVDSSYDIGTYVAKNANNDVIYSTTSMENGENGRQSYNVVRIPQWENIADDKDASYRAFVYFQTVLSEKAFDSNGNKIANHVTITSNDLINFGAVQTPEAADAVLNKFTSWIADISFVGLTIGQYSKSKRNIQATSPELETLIANTFRSGKNIALPPITDIVKAGKVTAMDAVHPFSVHYEKNNITISLYDQKDAAGDLSKSPHVNWHAIFNFTVRLPGYAGSLSTNALNLLYYLSSYANMHGDLIKKYGKLDISYEKIRYRLALPTIEQAKKNRHVGQDIADVILSAIAEINQAEEWYRGSEEAREINIISHVNDDKPRGYAVKMIEEQSATIEFRGETKNYYIQRGKNKAAKIEQAEKRRVKIKEEAQIRLLEKEIKNTSQEQ